jgi:hypothetical protein
MPMRRGFQLVPAVLLVSSCLGLDPDIEELAVNITLDRTTIGLGESIQVTVTALNYGEKPITLRAPTSCLLFFEIRELVQRTVMYSSNDVCTGDVESIELRPGEERAVTLTWDGTSRAGTRLAPGNYSLTGAATLVSRTHAGATAIIAIE